MCVLFVYYCIFYYILPIVSVMSMKLINKCPRTNNTSLAFKLHTLVLTYYIESMLLYLVNGVYQIIYI